MGEGLGFFPTPEEAPARRERKATAPKAAPIFRSFEGVKVDSDWTAPTEFPRLSGVVGFDLETKDDGLRMKKGPGWCWADHGYIVGVGLAWGKGEKGYWPIRHEGGGNLDEKMVLRWLRDELQSTDIQLVCHNATYDRGWLRREGIEPRCIVHDTQTAAALLDEYRRSYALDALGKAYLGRGKDETLLKKTAKRFGLDPKSDMWRLPAAYVGAYGSEDPRLTLDLWDRFQPLLAEEGLRDIYERERRLHEVLIEMRWRGVRVDVDGATAAIEVFEHEEEKLLQRIKEKVGFAVGIWEAESIAKAFDRLGIPYERTERGAPSFRQDWLKNHEHPIPRAITKARVLNKTRTTFLQSYVLDNQVKGRIHAQFNPLRDDDGGTVSGRFSSSDPNLQNLPARNEGVGPLVRGLFLPEEGQLWASADYAQQEPRLIVHYASLAKCTGADLAVAAYHNDPTTDYHKFVAELTGLPRPQAKELNLGLGYGMGGALLCHKLGLPTVQKTLRNGRVIEVAGEEGDAIIKQYHAKLPFMRELQQSVERRGEQMGFIRTLLGRRCRFGEGKDFARKALNRLIQGSAADQSKAAMLDLWDDHRIAPLVVVHDELGCSVVDEAQGSLVVQAMQNATPLRVPSRADIGFGESWGAAKH